MRSGRENTTLTRIRSLIEASPAAALIAGAILGPPIGLDPPSGGPPSDE